MRHITRIHIRGFQSHADTVLNLSPGLNAITGPSDNGKSAVLRALRWWAWNQAPDGDWMRKGCTLTSVEVTLSDGTVILRERRNDRNRYVVSLPSTDPLALVDFGRQVPAEVLRAHGMLPIAFDPDKPSVLNLAAQLEPPFFVTEPAPTRARMLGRLAGVHVIDAAIKGANRDLQATAREIRAREVEAERLTQQLEGYRDLEHQEARVARAEAALAAIPPMEARTTQLKQMRDTTVALEGQAESTQATLRRLQGVEQAAGRLTAADAATVRRGALATRRSELAIVTAAIDQATRIVAMTTRAAAAGDPVSAAAGLQERVVSLTRIQTARASWRAAWVEVNTALKATAGAIPASEAAAAAEQAHGALARLRAVQAGMRGVLTSLAAAEAAGAAAYARQLYAEPVLAGAVATQDRLAALIQHRLALADTDSRLVAGHRYLTGKDEQIAAATADYASALREAGRCPTCLQAVTPDVAAEIAAGLAHTH